MKSGFPQRGQVWEVTLGSHQYRVLIISNDEFNELPGAVPWGLAVERTAPSVPGHLVRMSGADPLPGAAIAVPRVLRCQPTALRRNLGFVTNDTLNAVERGLREFLNLP